MITTAYILCAGTGTRLRPYTSQISKPLLPLVNKPLLVHLVARFLDANFTTIGVIVSPTNRAAIQTELKKYFPTLNPQIIVQEKPLGTAHAVLQIAAHNPPANFLVIAGDSLFSTLFITQLAKTHLKEKNWVTLSLEHMPFELMKHSSTVDYREGQVWAVREKPQSPGEVLSTWNSAAFYALSRHIFPFLKQIGKSKRNEYELGTAYNMIIEQDHRIGGVMTERVFHISNPHDLWQFNLGMLRESPDTDAQGNLIGQNVTIDPTATVFNSVIGDSVTIQAGLSIIDSVILPHTVISQNYRNALVQGSNAEIF